jgi:flagellar biosynthesis/type III secretory pathway protein FliH
MGRLALWLFLAGMFVASVQAQDQHLDEPGTSVVLAHSAFAHGYRHGYEEGYHFGNADITLGAQPRPKPKEVKGRKLKLGYSSQFGPKQVFEQGFDAGLKAGYSDGYNGRTFRAVDSLRAVAASLNDARLPPGSKFASFDQGFFSGYNEGLERAGAGGHASAAEIDFRKVECSASSAKSGGASDQESYCEGYRRGFALGHADGFAQRTESTPLEASK